MSHIEALRVVLKKSGVPIRSEEDVEEDGELDRGAFGIVTKGTLKTDNSKVVIKQMENLIDADDLKLFCKEIKLLARMKHPNIVRLVGVVLDPVSAILERLEFNLNEMNIPQIKGSKKGNNLADLLRFLNRFEVVDEVGVTRGVLHTAAVDVARGLSFLHQNGICHRDLKPANVLVKNSEELFKCKLADFGEARARDLQTASFPHTATDRVQRGTEAFFAPEQVLESLTSANLSDLKRIDIWGYGLTIFCLLSPDLIQPWQVERRSSTLEVLMTNKKLPQRSDKYKHLPEHTGLGEVFTSCCQYDPANRPAMDDVMSILTKMTDSHKKTGSSASLATSAEHGDQRDIRSESTKENRKRPETSEALVDDLSIMNIASEPTEKKRTGWGIACSPRNTGSSASPTAANEKHVPAGDEADIVSEPSKAKRRRLVTSGASVDWPSIVSKPTEEKRVLPVTTPRVQGLAASSWSASAHSGAGTTRKEPFVLVKRTKKVKICRGCNSKFPETIRSPDDLVVRRRERYEFFNKKVRMMTPTVKNRFYHANASCLLSHGEHTVDNLVIPPDIELSDEHFALCAKRGLTLDRFVKKNVQ